MTVKKIENRPTFVKVMSECIVAQYIWLTVYTVFQKKTPTHIIGYKLRSSGLILIIFDTNIPYKIWHHMAA